jgi:hypothetical protein
MAMKGYRQGSINFLPPQIYELSRLANFQKLSNFIEFLSKRENEPEHRIERMLGICYKTPEASMLVMPGDGHYPSDASFTTPILVTNRTLKDFDSKIQNRLIMMHKGDDRTWQIHYQNESENNKTHLHVKPLTDGWEK